jgi:hypothetical protein
MGVHITQIPVELLHEVLLILPRSSQRACLLSCRALRAVALPVVFRKISIAFGSWQTDPLELTEASDIEVTEENKIRSHEILDHIRRTPSFANLCQILIVYAYARDGGLEMLGSCLFPTVTPGRADRSGDKTS